MVRNTMHGIWRILTVASAISGTLLGFVSEPKADIGAFSDPKSFDKLVEESNGFPSQQYRSSGILGPVFQVNIWNISRTDDSRFIFIGSVYGDGKAGPMILDARDLSLVYADQQYANTYHSDVQYIKGQPYFMFWEGTHGRGHANWYCLFFDENYDLAYNVTAQNRPGVLADMHDLGVTHKGNVLFTTYFNIPWDTSAVGGEVESLIMDSGFQEVDIVTNEVIFDWAASEHFDITASKAPYGDGYGVGPDSGYDFAQVNSVEKTLEGDYLISMRHLSVVALISGVDGHPIWIFGGKLNQFEDLSEGRATDFSWQHDARFHLGNTSQITMFDNHGEQTDQCHPGKPPGCHTRGLHLELDYKAMTAKVLQEYYHPEGLNSGAMGGISTLKNGNVMLAWGYNPSYTEFAPDGSLVLSFDRGKRRHLPDMFAYRVMKGNWVGRPTWPPSLAVDRQAESTENATAYLSWNGATEVVAWEIYASDNLHDILNRANSIAKFDRDGFETIVPLGSSVHVPRRYLIAAALATKEQILGSTTALDMLDGSVVKPGEVFKVLPRAANDRIWLHTVPILLLVAMVLCIAALVWRSRKALGDVEKGWYKPVRRIE